MNVKDWIARIDAIADMSESEREALREVCRLRGYHTPSGERLMLNPPKDVCWDCLRTISGRSAYDALIAPATEPRILLRSSTRRSARTCSLTFDS